MSPKKKDDWFDGVTDELAQKALGQEEEQEERAKEKEYPFWDEEETPILKGFLEKLSYWRDDYDNLVPILIVKDVDTEGHVKVWASRTILKKELELAKPAVGKPFAIQSLGKVEGKSSSYYMYNVVASEMDAELWQAARKKFLDGEKDRQEEAVTPPVRQATGNSTGYAPDEEPF